MVISWSCAEFCYVGGYIGDRGSPVDKVYEVFVMRGVHSGIYISSTSRGLPIRPKGRLDSTHMRGAKLHGSETRPVEEDDVTRLGKNDSRMVAQCIFPTKFCRRSLWFGHLERIKKSLWLSIKSSRFRGLFRTSPNI